MPSRCRPTLSGLGLEYRIVQLYSRDAGKREATFSFDTGQGTQDLGFRNEVSVLFDCKPARADHAAHRRRERRARVASLLIRDQAGRVYPSQAKRLAPDFFFHPQVYRADGEMLKLPDGEYDIEFQRGPESLPETRHVTVDAQTRRLALPGEALDRSRASSAGGAAIITSTPRAARTTRSRPRASMRRT